VGHGDAARRGGLDVPDLESTESIDDIREMRLAASVPRCDFLIARIMAVSERGSSA
jgi:hypothetical protein